jgi:hypothetical protein
MYQRIVLRQPLDIRATHAYAPPDFLVFPGSAVTWTHT